MKIRLDQYLMEKFDIQSREKSKAYIMAGQVYINGQKSTKAGDTVKPDDEVEFRGAKIPYVSRGGLKLEKAIKEFGVTLDGDICMDIGASTGGFSDCMLQNGASKIYAVDVGYGQLAWKLRTNPNVINLERTNIRYVTEEQVPEKVDFISIDVSFISLSLVLPVAYKFSGDEAEVLCLIKPQFEAGREKVGKKGVVREKSTHIEVIKKIYDISLKEGFYPKALSFSPVKGPEGNIEYLYYISKKDTGILFTDEEITDIVNVSHSDL